MAKQPSRLRPAGSILVLTAVWVLFNAPGASAQFDLPLPDSAASDSGDYAFRADRLDHDFRTDRVILNGNAVVLYKGIELKAGRIVFDRDGQTVIAEPLPDSAGGLTVGVPRFKRGSEQFSGSRMVYDLGSGRGRVTGGRAVADRKYYRGEDILLKTPRELRARNISMSTCDLENPHYDFVCRDLKAVEDDKAVARSVTFRIGPVPVFWVPYYVFPLKQGRHSGILTPAVGSNDRDGIFVRNVGYYLAPSDYWDATVSTTLREHTGYLIDTRLRYAIRSRLNGDVGLSYESGTTSTGATRRNWRFGYQHRQQVDPTLSLRADGTFTSSSTFDERNSDDLYNYLNRQLRSTASLAKSWSEAGRSLDAGLAYYRDLETRQNRFQGFPRVSFRQGRRRIFQPPESPSGRRSTPGARRASGKWYHAFYYSLSGGLTNNFTRNPDDASDTRELLMDGRLSVNSQHRPFGWLDLTPNFSVSQNLSHNDQDAPTRRESYVASVSSGTTLYGIFAPRVGRLRGVRHRFQPRVDFRYTQSARAFGGTFGFGGHRDWGHARRSFNGGIGNVLELKTEVDGQQRRFTLATLNISSGYDLDATGQKWRPLSTTASVKPDNRVDVRMSASHSFYDASGQRSMLSPTLQSFRVTSSLRLIGGRQAQTDQDLAPDAGMLGQPTAAGIYGRSRFGVERSLYGDIRDNTEPWRLYVEHHYDLDKRFGPTRKTSWLKADLGLSPLPGWRVDYSANYDLVDARVTSQSLSAYRRLHCWEARFAWYPTGFNKGFYFKLNVRDIPQIKLEHRQGGYGL